MTNPTQSTWRSAIERGVQIATARKVSNMDTSYPALYKDFFNSCQNVPVKWLKDFTFEVIKEMLTQEPKYATIRVRNKE